MLHISKRITAEGLAQVLLKRAASVELDWDLRQKSRFDATDSHGRALGVFLPRGSVLRGGDVLVAQDGSLIRVLAAAQPLLRITPEPHGSPFDLIRAAYHLGNRHVPIELKPDFLQIEPDPVLADLLRRMHLEVTPLQAPFEPESGAYAAHGQAAAATVPVAAADAAPGHSHSHRHPSEAAAASAAPAHVHGPDCGHSH